MTPLYERSTRLGAPSDGAAYIAAFFFEAYTATTALWYLRARRLVSLPSVQRYSSGPRWPSRAGRRGDSHYLPCRVTFAKSVSC